MGSGVWSPALNDGTFTSFNSSYGSMVQAWAAKNTSSPINTWATNFQAAGSQAATARVTQ